MTRKTYPNDGVFSEAVLGAVREISGVIAAESSTLNDTNFPASLAVPCRGFETVWVGVEIDGGTNPTATLEILVRDPEAADGLRWKKMLVGAAPGVTLTALASQKTGALDGTALQEVRVYGRDILFRVDAVTNATSTTAMRVLLMPGRRC